MYALSDYVLDVRRERDTAMATFQWVFDPVWGIVEGLGLRWARGECRCCGRGYIEAEWEYENGTGGSGEESSNNDRGKRE
jgi:hypothetical protein